VRDLAFIAFLLALFGIGFRRPFVLVLTYVYIDIVSPQRLTYLLLNNIQISLIAVIAAVGAWAVADDKTHVRIAPRQILMAILLLYCGLTTTQADFPIQAADKWGWVWKALAFAIFLPMTLHTRLRIESLALFLVLSASSIIVVGGIKTLASGGGYGVLNLMVTNNTGIYESSIISVVAIMIIPIILFLMKYGTVFPPDWRVKIYGAALIFSALLIPVGTQARTGLICIGVLGILVLRSTKRRFLYLGLVGAAALIATPYLPTSFTDRMGTIKTYQADQSASTRLAVWAWTWDYVQKNPMGGGFDAFRGNKLRIETVNTQSQGTQVNTSQRVDIDKARAYHSSYFEMLGEQGFFGLFIWLLINVTGLVRMEVVFRKYRNRAIDEDQWIGALASALQQAHIIFLAGALFVGIAFQPFVFMLVGLQIGLDTYASRRAREAAWRPISEQKVLTA
jgi:probable O-glycosylation ligase (exosortase A-associated)